MQESTEKANGEGESQSEQFDWRKTKFLVLIKAWSNIFHFTGAVVVCAPFFRFGCSGSPNNRKWPCEMFHGVIMSIVSSAKVRRFVFQFSKKSISYLWSYQVLYFFFTFLCFARKRNQFHYISVTQICSMAWWLLLEYCFCFYQSLYLSTLCLFL